MVSFGNFIVLVRNLRAAQRSYFTRRDQASLLYAKEMERDVDRLLDGASVSEEGLFDVVEGNAYRCAVIEYRTKELPEWRLCRLLSEKDRDYVSEEGIRDTIRTYKERCPAWEFRYRYGEVRLAGDGSKCKTY